MLCAPDVCNNTGCVGQRSAGKEARKKASDEEGFDVMREGLSEEEEKVDDHRVHEDLLASNKFASRTP